MAAPVKSIVKCLRGPRIGPRGRSNTIFFERRPDGTTTVSLTDRTGVPTLGLGTYRNDDPEQCAMSVRTALDVGYRHIDTAEAYGNEAAVGDGLRAADVEREAVFLATKVLHPKFTDSYETDAIVESGRACLDRLEVEQVELFYGIHWPNGEPPAYDVDAVARACEQLHDEGRYDHLGVCNLTPPLIDEFRDAVDLPVEAVQVEMHPLWPQRELRAYCADHDIDLVAYGPLGNGLVFDDPTLEQVATDRGVSVAQVSLAWLREQGVAAIPKATGEGHIRDNFGSLDLDLTDDELATIDGIDREERVYDPPYAPNW